jgi:hypothetical protein
MKAQIVVTTFLLVIIALMARVQHGQASTILRLNGDVARLTVLNSQCQAELTAKDAAINDIRKAGELDKQRHRAAEEQSAIALNNSHRQIQKILTAAVPSECPAAMQWLHESGREIARQWESANVPK